MIKLDDNLLQELGLGALPPEEKKKMLAHIYETLEMRVGMALAKQMNDGQLNEFEQFIKSNDEAGALRWLETNFPNYRDVVAAEFEKLKGEIKQTAPQIMAASQQQFAAPPAPGYGQPMQQAPYPAQPMQPYGAPSQAAAPAPMASSPYGPGPQPQSGMPPAGYGPQPQPPMPPAGQQPYYQPQPAQPQQFAAQPQQQPDPASAMAATTPQPQPLQTFDPQQQAQGQQSQPTTQQPYPSSPAASQTQLNPQQDTQDAPASPQP